MDTASENELIRDYEAKDFDAVNKQVTALYANMCDYQNVHSTKRVQHTKKKQECQLELTFDFAV